MTEFFEHELPSLEPEIEGHELISDDKGLGILEQQFADNPDALALNTAFALAAALRCSTVVLRNNNETVILGASSTEIIEQGWRRLNNPERTKFPEVYTGLLPSNGTESTFLSATADYIKDRKAYLEQFTELTNDLRHLTRLSLYDKNTQICHYFERLIEAKLQQHVRDQSDLDPALLQRDVFRMFCERALVPLPSIRNGSKISGSILASTLRTVGLTPMGRAWLRKQYEIIV